MIRRIILVSILTVAVCATASAQTPQDAATKVAAIATYERGQSRQPIIDIEELVRASHGKPDVRSALVNGLIELLEGEATRDARLFACRQLWQLGPERALPVLSDMLIAEDSVDVACYAIALDPSPRAGKALRDALGKAEGRSIIAIVNLLGDRRDTRAVKALTALASRDSEETAVAAVTALGVIGGKAAAEGITGALRSDYEAVRTAATDAALRCAEGFLDETEPKPAVALYTALTAEAYPVPVQNAARLGLERAKLGKPVVLFDGETFKGWEGNLDWFRIEDGGIVAGTFEKPIPNNEFLCTKKAYGDFELRLSVKLLGKRANAGIQIRSKRVPDHHEVSGYQADMGKGYWGALYDESRRNKILASPDADAFKPFLNVTDWNDYVIRCEGNHVQLWVNGYKTVDYTEPDDAIARSGIIGLQIHGGPPSEAYYRNIVIREIAPVK
ncbi:MAG: DUF1080 domain-containing protein [bacterium]|nr:DUF1080 domain-containing protein [bacterium]